MAQAGPSQGLLQTPADKQHKPVTRLETPVTMQYPNNHPGAHFVPVGTFVDVPPESLREKYELIYDPENPPDPADPHREHEPKWCGDFESGNLGKVYEIGKRRFEVHMLPDPNTQQTCQWFFFRIDRMTPGEYFFVIVGFYRNAQLHKAGAQIVAHSENASRAGIGWRRVGEDMNYFKWKSGKFPEWALSFTITVEETDTMHFAQLYPYTYTDQMNTLGRLQPLCRSCALCRSVGGIEVPCVFWDADAGTCQDIAPVLEAWDGSGPVEPSIELASHFGQRILAALDGWGRTGLPEGPRYTKKPLIVVAARIHPGESGSSYSMEGFLRALFTKDELGSAMRRAFSFLIVPMLNPDGVICGFYRPSLSGDDLNRVWRQPDAIMHPEVESTLRAISALAQQREVPVFIDFHGHTAAFNTFCYGFGNDDNPHLYSAERLFPLLLTKHLPHFSNEMCSYLKQAQYEGTMRVVVRRRYHALFAYTIESSFGGADFGPGAKEQFTPNHYRLVGEATVRSIADMLLAPSSLAAREVIAMRPPPEKAARVAMPFVYSQVLVDGEVEDGAPRSLPVSFAAEDISDRPPEQLVLAVAQRVRQASTAG